MDEYTAISVKNLGPGSRVYDCKNNETGSLVKITYHYGDLTLVGDYLYQRFGGIECSRVGDRLTFQTHAGNMIAGVDMAEVA